MKALLPIGMFLLASPALAANTLCTSDEKVVFSCATSSSRIISLCSSKLVSKGNGYMQYRFGKKDRVDLVYPETQVPPAGHFVPGNLMFSGGGGAYLQFNKGGYQYTVFSAIGNWSVKGGKAEVRGVAVSNGGKEVANLPCRMSPDFVRGDLGPEFFATAGLGESVMDFEIPEAFFPK